MIILITASTFPRWQEDCVPRFILDQAVALGQTMPDAQIHILAPHDAGAERYQRWQKIHIHRFRYAFPERWQRLVYPAILPNIRHNRWLSLQVPLLLLAETVAIYRLLRTLRPDVVYSHWFVPQAIAGSLPCLLLRTPHVFTSHSSDVQVMAKLPVIGPALVRFIITRMRACTAVSQRSLDKLQSFFSASAWAKVAHKVSIIPMGVDVQSLAGATGKDARTREDSASLSATTAPVILFMGRLSEKKGVSFLLQAFHELQKSGISDHRLHAAELRIAGDGELADHVRSEIITLGLQHKVTMLGYVNGANKLACIADADILVVPSIITDDGDAEGLPVTLIEGLAAGKLCIATDVSGADDILIDNENGFLVEARNSDALATAIRHVLTLDDETSRHIQDAARACAWRFDWATIARQHCQHLFSPTSTVRAHHG